MMSSGGSGVSASSRSSVRPLRSPSTIRSFSRPFDRVGALLLRRVRRLAVGEHLQQALQRVVVLGPAVEDQVLGDLHLLRRDQVQRADLGHVHDRAGHAGAHRMVEEHRVQHRARGRIEAEADVRQAEDDLHVRELLPDQP